MKEWVMRDNLNGERRHDLDGYSPLMQGLLYSRGIGDKDEAEKFFNPNYERDIHDPFLAMDMLRAVERIEKAITNNELIIIFGDYDADGVPGSALLQSVFELIGHEKFRVYIQDRYTEQYSLSVEAVENFATWGARLIITVDCGITDVLPAKRASELGIDLIITDHHMPHEKLPDAYAVIDNKREDDRYPFKYLCFAGTP